MRARVLTAIVLLALFISLLFLLPPIFIVVAAGLVSGLMAWEFLGATKAVEQKQPFLYLSCLCAALVPFTVYSRENGLWPLLLVLFAYLLLSAICAIRAPKIIGAAQLGKGFFVAMILPLLLSSCLRILLLPELGQYLVLMPWVTVWVCDTFALFCGKFFGKHKLAPSISPKKTVEGAIGGLIGGVLSMAVYLLVLRYGFAVALDWVPALLFGLFGAAVGQVGDLFFSLIKREAGIKDYGKILPGHGGALDRLDSFLFAAPLFEIIYLHILLVL